MVHIKSSVGFALFLTVASIPFSTGYTAELRLAQAPLFNSNSVPKGTRLKIVSSPSMKTLDTALKQRFEKQYPDAQIALSTTSTPAALQAVLNNQANLAAIARPLTAQEKAQGLNAVEVGRDKIAIIVGKNNPFAKSISINQFAGMFRGDIKNWSQVGGPAAPIRFIDRPESDTRQSFRRYPVFEQGKFATGATAERVKPDTLQTVSQRLGTNGISYAPASQIKNQPTVKAVSMDGVKPTDARYPFSQPLYYVYKGTPNAATQAFLGYATGSIGQSAIEQAGVSKAASGQTVQTAPNNAPGGSTQAGGGNAIGLLPQGGNDAGAESGFPNWLGWLLPIASGAGLLWLLARSRRLRRSVDVESTGYAVSDSPRGDAYVAPSDRRAVYPDVTANGNLETPDVNYVSSDRDTPEHDAMGRNRFPVPDLDDSSTSIRSDGASRSESSNLGLGSAAILGGAAAAGVGTWAAISGNRKSRVVLKTRNAQEVEAFWDIAPDERQAARQQGGEKLALRLYDVTDIDLDDQSPHSIQQFDCDELTQRQRIPIGLGDRDYLAEIGYLTANQQWLALARSSHVRVPTGVNPFGNAARSSDSPQAFFAGDTLHAPDIDSPTSFESESHNSLPSEPSAPTVYQPISQPTDTSATGGSAAAWSFLSDHNSPATPSETVRQPFVSPADLGERSTDSNQVGGYESASAPMMSPPVNHVVTDESVPDQSLFPNGEGRLVLTPRNARWAYAYWDIPRSQRAKIDRQSGENLVLRLYDVTDRPTDLLPDHFEQHDVDDLALNYDVPIPAADRTYIAEIGYVNSAERWIRLAKSEAVRVPSN